MRLNRKEAALEAVLFAAGEAVSLEKLAAALELDKDTAKRLALRLQDTYQLEQRGMRIMEIGDGFQMCTCETQFEAVRRLVGKEPASSLTDAQVETLSIIAYRQPVTKAHIEKIRGVKSDGIVNKLVEYDLVCELGRMDGPGRPILFGTTQAFLRSFGLRSLEDLPQESMEKGMEMET
ncbi:SMC-Scp complex subunit ScpB [Anaerotalea alkaliphila]|uniref:SMC-Scp complex subunit ScpB n=1 Tax=Anaerotalea alkaliphila TaxID=2662126 RepID=A0A7X5HTA8_9FIRM|nr:SMC-Scp complex subunit ScpB [Anaerotalea alkaliphila]NDL66293.1 SMC-Scp complex subunit ScpB [Anaerotalea alkaliphila]